MLAQDGDPRLERVVRGGQPVGLAPVARRGVRAGQPVQPFEQRAGVGDVATHGRVGPAALAVPVEAQMQLGQPGDRLDRVPVEPERLEPPRDQLRADDLVVVEAHAAVLLEPSRRGFADVVQQRRESQHQIRARHRAGRPGLQVDRLLEHRERVLVDVLVPVVLVDLEPQRGQLGEHVVGETGVDEDLESAPRSARDHQLDQLVAYALGRHDRDALGHLLDRGARVRVEREPELRDEPRRPHHAQRIVVERLARGHRRAQRPPCEVGEPVERVHERQPGQAHGHRVHGEVPP